jgi:hypothetical protein
MPRLSISQVRQLWSNAIAEKGWQASTLEKVMFDWQSGKLTMYFPNPPAFYSISDELDTVDEEQYLKLQAELIRRGEQRSDLGRRRSDRQNPAAQPLAFHPSTVTQDDIQEAMKSVMCTVHPLVVRQEQILRCALIAHLPESVRNAIGTLRANLHPELPTASKEYQRKGSKKRRARIDVGFGHPMVCEETIGVLELKALTSFNETRFERQLERLNTTPAGLMFSGLAGDFQKLLDPKLPRNTFRCSWAVTKKRSAVEPEQIAQWARGLLEPVERRLSLEGFEQEYDPVMHWLRWKWKDGSAVNLAWYWPKHENPEQFEPVWI